VTGAHALPGALAALALLVPLASAASGAPPPFGLGDFDADEPIAITADKLEAVERDGVRTLSFQRNVEVRQGALVFHARHLEARFPEGARQPVWLEARGDVRIRERERRAHCDQASYDRGAQRIVCRGTPARLRDGDDTLEGREVVFDLDARRVTVEGGADVEIHRSLAGETDEPAAGDAPATPEPVPEGPVDAEAAPGDAPAGAAAPQADRPATGPDPRDEALQRIREGGPVAIRADALEAHDREGARTIRFHGDVRVRQGGLTLRAGELQALYPPQGRKPDRLLAQDDVVIREGEREARCQRADYRPSERSVTCEGDARLRDGADRLFGEKIAFDFGARQVRVSGDTRLVVQGRARP